MSAIGTTSPILVVDDHKTMLRIFRSLLRQVDCDNVHEAGDGAEALARLRAADYALVISDWNMQPMTGLLQEVRRDRRLKPLPFIMVAAAGNVENVAAARHAGASHYLVKPFNAETLRDSIAQALAHS